MIEIFRPPPWLIAPVFFLVACSQGPASPPASPSNRVDTTNSSGTGSGIVTSSAAGDVQNGPIEIFNVRVAPAGGTRFYANPGGVYRIDPGVPVELWVEWRSTQTLSTVPRLIINWGFTEPDNIHCGPCLLNKTFPEGLHTVTVTLDDRIAGTTKRTFQIDTRPLPPQVTFPAVGTSGTAGVVSGNPWIVCRADAQTAFLSANTAGGYNPNVTCASLGYARTDFWGGTCGTVCGYCGTPGLEQYDRGAYSGAGNCGGAIICSTVQWRCTN